uniref:Uncharacterized protein n=1 Tax=Nelumbo nucifera TaxID=4432 RepID=A0A822ZMP3_NELNU|nr:TPA_asm: hypothetical protein HUJ06_003021 [Nelumbo nucifera]
MNINIICKLSNNQNPLKILRDFLSYLHNCTLYPIPVQDSTIADTLPYQITMIPLISVARPMTWHTSMKNKDGTCKPGPRRPARAKSNVVFPELGGPSSSVNLQSTTR